MEVGLEASFALYQWFCTDQLIGLEGYGEGALKMEGALSNLDIDGEVYLDSAYRECSIRKHFYAICQ